MPTERPTPQERADAAYEELRQHAIFRGDGTLEWDKVRNLFRNVVEAAVAQAREEDARIVEDAYPCTCDEAYTSRKLTAPDCFHCVPLAEAAAEIRARKDQP